MGFTLVIESVELHNYFPEAIDFRVHLLYFTHGSLKQWCRSRHAVQYGHFILTACQSGKAADTYCVVFGLFRPGILSSNPRCTLYHGKHINLNQDQTDFTWQHLEQVLYVL